MKSIKLAAGLLACGLVAGAHATVVLSEGFENYSGLAAAGWVFTNNSASPLQPWFAGNSAVFGAQAGSAGSYVAANFDSTSSATGLIDNWLISPVITLGAGAMLDFFTQGENAPGFFDMLEVRFGTGSSSSVSNFTTLLATIGDGSSQYPTNGWSEYLLALPTAATGRIAFRYRSSDASNADYIGIDSVSVTAVPEPGTTPLVGVAMVAAVLAMRRRNSAPSTTSPSA